MAVIGRLKLSGFVAWAAWLLVHVFFLIGFRNRFVVMFTWGWAYLTYERSARLIVPRPPALRPPPTASARRSPACPRFGGSAPAHGHATRHPAPNSSHCAPADGEGWRYMVVTGRARQVGEPMCWISPGALAERERGGLRCCA